MKTRQLYRLTSFIVGVLILCYSCNSSGNNAPASELTKIQLIKVSSDQSYELSQKFFNINQFTHQIWNNDFLKSGTELKEIKLEIITHSASKISINHKDWNGKDPIAYNNKPIIITVFAQNSQHSQDYTLQININK